MSAEKQLRCCERQRQQTVLLAGVVVGRRVVKDLECCWQNGGNGISGGSWLWGQQQQQSEGYNCDPVTTAVSLITSLLFLDDFNLLFWLCKWIIVFSSLAFAFIGGSLSY